MQPIRGKLVDKSVTIAEGGTSQLVTPFNIARYYLLMQNPSSAAGPAYFNFGEDATVGAPSIELAPGQSLVFETGFIPTDAVYVLSATTDAQVTIKEGGFQPAAF